MINLIKREYLDAVKRLDESRSRILKRQLGSWESYWDFRAILSNDDAFMVIEELNSSNSSFFANNKKFKNFSFWVTLQIIPTCTLVTFGAME